MNFEDIKINNRLQIECENEDPILRNIKGIVLDVGRHSVILVTDFGSLIEIDKDNILSITKINFDKIVSDALMELKNYYTEKYELEIKLKKLKEREDFLIGSLYDANFLAKFNVVGAKNRLYKSIDKDLLKFTKDLLEYQICFEPNPDDMIEIRIRVFNYFEYYNSEKIDTEKIIKVHAPREKDVIEKSFNLEGNVEELDNQVVHDKDNWYSVSTNYRLCVSISQDNFLSVRDEIIKGLIRLRK